MANKPTDKELSFERSIDKLEDIVEQIESGEVGLEQALEQYEQGQALIKRCRGILDKAERRIAELTEGADGKPTIAASDPDADEPIDEDPDD